MPMTRPRRFLIRMTAFLVVVGAVAGGLSSAMIPFFMSNPVLNGLICGVLAVGVALNVRQVTMLSPELAWIDRFREDQAAVSIEDAARAPRLLAPMATMLRDHKGRGRFTLSAPAMRSLLDGIASRLDEARELSRYFIGLSVFLGLLGTFWGLLVTVGAISEVIGSLDASGQGDMAGVFENLKLDLEKPLSGMGTAFSSSLFGLAGSLVLGFLDLQAGQAQNAFYNALEEWLSAATRLGVGGGEDASAPAYIQALLEQTAESVDALQATIAKGEESRAAAGATQRQLVDRLATLTDQMRAEQQVLLKMAESQIDMKGLIGQLAGGLSRRIDGAALDDASKGHLRNMDVHLGRLAAEASSGRDAAVKEIRNEIKLLARTIANLADDARI